ncbi:MAG: hypothetical protein AB1634_08050 [Thermodesulfobacteriota bacterium]
MDKDLVLPGTTGAGALGSGARELAAPKSVRVMRHVMFFVLAAALPFIVAELAVQYYLAVHPNPALVSRQEIRLSSQERRVEALARQVKALRSGDYAERFAYIAGGRQQGAALEERLSGRIRAAEAELAKAEGEASSLPVPGPPPSPRP